MVNTSQSEKVTEIGLFTSSEELTDKEIEKQKIVRRVAGASFLGNFIEWFDYGTYIYFATIISTVFFPEGDPTTALIKTYGVFAISFIFRPIGALVWGTLGDKKGRKWALTASIMLMTGATAAIGLVPSYQSIGFIAAVLLMMLRMLQGFSASGEYAGAAIFLGEYAPVKQRGLYCSLVPASTAAGLLMGSFFAVFLNSLFKQDFLHSYGWRIPFLLALPLGLIVLYMRVHIEDSEVYKELKKELHQKGVNKPTPLTDLFRYHFKEVVIAFGVASLNAVGFYLVLSYLANYVETVVGLSVATSSTITSITLVTYIGFIFAMGKLSDRFGRRTMLILASVCFIILTVPSFMLLNTKHVIVILLVELLLCACLTINDGTLASFLAETFPTEVRYTGFALSFNMANVIFGGTAPLIATSLIKATGDNLAPAYYLVFIAVIALVAMFFSEEHSHKKLD